MKVTSQEGFHTGEPNAAVKAAAKGMEALAGQRQQTAAEAENTELRVSHETGAQVLSKEGKQPL